MKAEVVVGEAFQRYCREIGQDPVEAAQRVQEQANKLACESFEWECGMANPAGDRMDEVAFRALAIGGMKLGDVTSRIAPSGQLPSCKGPDAEAEVLVVSLLTTVDGITRDAPNEVAARVLGEVGGYLPRTLREKADLRLLLERGAPSTQLFWRWALAIRNERQRQHEKLMKRAVLKKPTKPVRMQMPPILLAA